MHYKKYLLSWVAIALLNLYSALAVGNPLSLSKQIDDDHVGDLVDDLADGKGVDYEACYQQILNNYPASSADRTQRVDFRGLLKRDVSAQAQPVSATDVPKFDRCYALFEYLYEWFSKSAYNFESLNAFDSPYYDYLFDEKVVDNIRNKINQALPKPTVTSSIYPTATLTTPTSLTTSSIYTASSSAMTTSGAVSSLSLAPTPVPSPDPTTTLEPFTPTSAPVVDFTDAQVKALIMNVAHLLLSKNDTYRNAFCKGPFIDEPSYLGCTAVMAKYYLLNPDSLDIFVLEAGKRSEEKLYQWMKKKDSVSDQLSVVAVFGHINFQNTLQVENIIGFAGIPDIRGDSFDPLEPLKQEEIPRLITGSAFKTGCETFSADVDRLSYYTCDLSSLSGSSHINGFLSGTTPGISGVDIEATLHRTSLSVETVDRASNHLNIDLSYPAVLIGSAGNNPGTIINSRIDIHLADPVQRTFDKKVLPYAVEKNTPEQPPYDLLLFYSSDVTNYIFSKNILRLDTCSVSYGGIQHRSSIPGLNPRVQIDMPIVDRQGQECVYPKPQITTHNDLTTVMTDSPLTTTDDAAVTVPVSLLTIALALSLSLLF